MRNIMILIGLISTLLFFVLLGSNQKIKIERFDYIDPLHKKPTATVLTTRFFGLIENRERFVCLGVTRFHMRWVSLDTGADLRDDATYNALHDAGVKAQLEATTGVA